MFALTADQIDSRLGPDLTEDALALIAGIAGDRLALPADRTAGDEVQLLTPDARTALEVLLALVRTGHWHTGLGIGGVREPLPDVTRAATGDALLAARDAVETAKRRASRAAVVVAGDPDESATVQALVELLLLLRERRTPEGWELADLLATGLTQAESASRLGITPQAASKRALAAGLRADAAARDALVRILERSDRPPTPEGRP